MSEKKNLCLDFDGVIHSYFSGWKGIDIISDPPVQGVFEFLEKANQYFNIYVYSSRSEEDAGIEAMKKYIQKEYTKWLKNSNKESVDIKIIFARKKPPAFLYIDDRGFTFTGTWPDVEELLKFKSWVEK